MAIRSNRNPIYKHSCDVLYVLFTRIRLEIFLQIRVIVLFVFIYHLADSIAYLREEWNILTFKEMHLTEIFSTFPRMSSSFIFAPLRLFDKCHSIVAM